MTGSGASTRIGHAMLYPIAFLVFVGVAVGVTYVVDALARKRSLAERSTRNRRRGARERILDQVFQSSLAPVVPGASVAMAVRPDLQH